MAFSAPRRHRFWSAFGSFGAAVPLRFAVLKPRLWGLVLGAQPKLSPAPPSPGQPKPWCGPCQSSANGFFLLDSDVAFSALRRPRFWCVFGLFGAAVPLRSAVLKPRLWGLVFGAHLTQPSPAEPSPAQELNQAQPKPWCGPCQSSAKGFFLLDSDVAFSAHRRHRFWSAFGSFGTAVPLRSAVLKPRLWGLVFGASSAQLRPAQAVVWALPKLMAFSGFRCGVFGPQAASVLVRFWLVWGRRAAALRCLGA